MSKIVWSDEATFKLNGTVNQHNYVYYAAENPYIHVDKEVSLPGLIMSGVDWHMGVSLNLSITGPIYLNMLWTSIFTCHSSALWE
jgi:hypothetical protein